MGVAFQLTGPGNQTPNPSPFLWERRHPSTPGPTTIAVTRDVGRVGHRQPCGHSWLLASRLPARPIPIGSVMTNDMRCWHHQAKHLPEPMTDSSGTKFLIFECILCGCGLAYELDAEDRIVKEYV